MEYFDAYEEVYAAIERYIDEHAVRPNHVNVSTTLFRWLLEMKKEAVTHHLEAPEPVLNFATRLGPVPIVIDELLSPYEIIVD